MPREAFRRLWRNWKKHRGNMAYANFARLSARLSRVLTAIMAIVLIALLAGCSAGVSQIQEGGQSSGETIDHVGSEGLSSDAPSSESAHAEEASRQTEREDESVSGADQGDVEQGRAESSDAAERQGATLGKILADLACAYESPSPEADKNTKADLEELRSRSEQDYELASAIVDYWNDVYANPSYQLNNYAGGKRADELKRSKRLNSEDHAFVVLGHKLCNGEMQDELKGRCDAAAAAARTFPKAMLICTGGPSGEGNPAGICEADLMKEYLVNQCSIDESRILVDNRAMSTVDNAVNVMELLRAHGIHKITVVTSSYHQRRAQMVFAIEALCYQQQLGYSVELVGNYNYPSEASSQDQSVDDRVTVMQIAYVLNLPEEEFELLPPVE